MILFLLNPKEEIVKPEDEKTEPKEEEKKEEKTEPKEEEKKDEKIEPEEEEKKEEDIEPETSILSTIFNVLKQLVNAIIKAFGGKQ